MYRKHNKRGTQRLSSGLRKDKSFQSLDVIPPERPLIQKLMFWKRGSCIPRRGSTGREEATSENLEQTVCFEPVTPFNPDKSGVTSSDESSSMASAAPLPALPPPPPPPPVEVEGMTSFGGEDPPAVDPPHEDQDATLPATPPCRPPLARRSVTVQEPPRRSAASSAIVVAPPALARGTSYNTSGSRHSRRNAGELPSLQQVFSAADDTTHVPSTSGGGPPRIPLSICARPRLVSALADEEDLDEDANLLADLRRMDSYDYSDDDEDAADANHNKDHVQDGSSSPASVIKESDAMPTSDLWMQAWVNQSNNAVTSVDGTNDDDNDSALIFEGLEAISGDDDSGSTPTTITYLPVEPVPKAVKNKTDDNNVVLICGWTAVLLNHDFSNAKQSGDDSVEESEPPSVDFGSIHYAQLLRSGHLQLISLVQGQERKIKIDGNAMRLEHVHNRAGYCLVVQCEGSETIALLPVNLPPACLLERRSTKKQKTPRFFAPFQDSGDGDECDFYDQYAPQAQHEAILHLRFAMEASLRALLLPRW